MRPLSPARTCHMAAFRTHEPQREAHARPTHPHALLELNATSFQNTEAVVDRRDPVVSPGGLSVAYDEM
jgi:hypothetical protein